MAELSLTQARGSKEAIEREARCSCKGRTDGRADQSGRNVGPGRALASPEVGGNEPSAGDLAAPGRRMGASGYRRAVSEGCGEAAPRPTSSGGLRDPGCVRARTRWSGQGRAFADGGARARDRTSVLALTPPRPDR
jgi:hypothetical protein